MVGRARIDTLQMMRATRTPPLRIFIGYDDREPAAYHVLVHSILSRASMPVSITSLQSHTLSAWYQRERSASQSTDFSFTRFLVPFLSGYTGVSLFLDCDMLCQADIAELGQFRQQEDKAVYVCQHDYTPKDTVKFLGHEQKAYPRKNWSSVMLFQNAACGLLTPDYVNTASAADLHQFAWVDSHDIGSLPLEWNWLVGEYPKNPDAKLLHYTLGGPWFEEYAASDHATDWIGERDRAMAAAHRALEV